MLQYCKNEKVSKDEPLTPAWKRLSLVPECEEAVQQWESDLERKLKEVKYLKESIKSIKRWLRYTEKNRSKLFARMLNDKTQVYAAYVDGRSLALTQSEIEQIYKRYNYMLIAHLSFLNVRKLAKYLRETEGLQTAADCDFIAATLIKNTDVNIIEDFLKVKPEYMTKESIDNLVEYIDSRKLADTIIAAN